MANPYEPPQNASRETTAAPAWYVLFYRLYQPAWWVGTALIVLSWLNVVTPRVGWVGFGIACVAVFGSYLFPKLARLQPEDFVVVDSRMLASKDVAYRDAIERFANGATLMYDGVCFVVRPDNEIASAIAISAAQQDFDDQAARDLADHARSVFENLQLMSPEFSSAVATRTFRISIMSSFDEDATEVCRVVDDQIEWRAHSLQ